MPIVGFEFGEFARNLTVQAQEVIPEDIQGNDREYIGKIVHDFCYMAGEALSNDTSLNFNADQASIVTQFIGEWAFHKAIDLIRSGIEPQFRDGTLQKIAFTVFEIAKQAILKEFSQEDMVSIVEHHVQKAFIEALEELKSRGALTEEQVDRALNASNIDAMAQQIQEEEEVQSQQVQEAPDQYQQQPAQNNPPPGKLLSNNKILKLATLAMVVKRLSQQKQESLLTKIDSNDAQVVEEYSQMDDLEEKIDPNVTIKCLNDIKQNLPAAKKVNVEKLYARLHNLVKNSEISKISNIVGRERSLIKKFVLGAADNRNYELAPRIGEIVCEYLEEKL